MSSSRISSAAHLPWLSSPAMKFGLIYKKGKKTATEFARVEKCEGMGTITSVDVFEARALGWYLKPRSEEVDASRCAKGNCN